MATDTINSAESDFPYTQHVLESVEEEKASSEISGDSSPNEGSEISLSEKIVLESQNKRLQERMHSLQSSITSLMEQLRSEKQMWKEDLEKIRVLQEQQQQPPVVYCHCIHQDQNKSKDSLRCLSASRSGSIQSLSLETINSATKFDKYLKLNTVKQLLEYQNYKRKLTETENLCNWELNKVKQSLEDIKALKSIAEEWGKNDDSYLGKRSASECGTTESRKCFSASSGSQIIHEIFVKQM